MGAREDALSRLRDLRTLRTTKYIFKTIFGNYVTHRH